MKVDNRKKIYKAREGAPFRQEEAEIIGKVLEEIESKKGSITPEDFVEYSRNPNSPTHHLFEWDDKKASTLYRIQQARDIINHIEIEIIADDLKPFRIRAFQPVVIKKGKGRVYYPVGKIVPYEEYALQVVKRLQNMLNSIALELEGFKKYKWLVDALRKLSERIKIRIGE